MFDMCCFSGSVGIAVCFVFLFGFQYEAMNGRQTEERSKKKTNTIAGTMWEQREHRREKSKRKNIEKSIQIQIQMQSTIALLPSNARERDYYTHWCNIHHHMVVFGSNRMHTTTSIRHRTCVQHTTMHRCYIQHLLGINAKWLFSCIRNTHTHMRHSYALRM